MSCSRSTFLTADQARVMSRDWATIFAEICALQQSIIANSKAGSFEVVFPQWQLNASTSVLERVQSTTMTTDPEYLQVWNEAVTNKSKLDQLEFVIAYFQDLGYAISIHPDQNSPTTISWKISW